MVIGAENFNDILKEELRQRYEMNPQYSMRSFAKYLDMSPGSICDIINGKQGISKDRAGKIAEKLGFNKSETDYFLTLVESAHARNKKQKKVAKQKLQEYKEKNYSKLETDANEVLSDWYYFAILELTHVSNFLPNIEWVAKRLGIAPSLVQEAIERLQRLKLLSIEPDGSWKDLNNYLMTTNEVPSRNIRRLHHQIICKAHRSVSEQTISERNLNSLILSFDESKMEEAKKMIMDFQIKFNEKMGPNGSANGVYCLAIQFFNLLVPRGH